MSVVMAALLQIISLLTVTSYLSSAQICYTQMSSYTSSVSYERELYYYRAGYTYYYSCGFWGWGSCSSSGYSLRSGYRPGARYSQQLQYSQTSICCSGYAGIPPDCDPVCSVCYNGGTCIAPENCSCIVGWTGRNCSTDVDECEMNTHGCDHICMNTPGSYNCSCNIGYILNNDSLTCTDIDECGIPELGGNCSQICVNTPGFFECQCNIGYRLSSDGFTCEDIDECLDDNGGCNHTCMNIVGSYECSCWQGYFLSDDQHTCVDHDECETGNHTCTQLCNNLPGTHECLCHTGYELLNDGYTCIDIDECRLGYCNQLCNNSEGSFTCSCQDGYALEDDGRTCIDINECATANGGCGHFCSNYPGSYHCSCRGGYTLEEDSSCTAQPCPNLMRPQNGNISCTGPQVTDENCTFTCDYGYEPDGSEFRRCLPDNTWSDIPFTCLIMSCPALTEPLNGAIILPCEYEFRSTCNLRCDDGFYSNDVLTQSCVLSADNSYVEWTEAPVCNAIRACEPYPCQHSGVCTALGPREFECDCTGTGYEGDMCQDGIIDLPQYPTLIAEDSPQLLSISARPGAFITIEFVSDDPQNLIFNPPSVTIHYPNTSANFMIFSTLPNLYTVNYVITGTSSDEFPTPESSTVLVTPLHSAPPNSYFTDRDVAIGLLQPGCCQLQDTAPSYQCPNGGQTLVFDATCNWRQQDDMHFVPGIVFLSTDGLTLPASISGATLSNNVASINQLNTVGLNQPCDECRTVMRGNDSISNVGDDCSTTFRPTVADINDFLNTESLAYSYFHYTNSLYPSWLKLLPINGYSRTHDTNSYQVTIVNGNELNDIDGCESLPVVEDGLYSVLQYSGVLIVSIPSISSHITYAPSDDATPLCFAVNLCAGSMTPFYIGLPTEAQSFFTNLPFIQYLINNEWYISSEALAIGVGSSHLNINIVNKLDDYQYWDGIQDFKASEYFTGMSLAVQGTVNKTFTQENLSCVLEFLGLSFLHYCDLNEAYNTGLQRRWVGVMDGNINLTVQVFVQGLSSRLVLKTEEIPGLFFIGEWEDGCATAVPSGLSFNLTYMPSIENTGLWSTIFRIPPNPSFGLPTQFSCPIDAFVALGNNMTVRGVQLRSQCVDVNVGSFQFNGNSLIHTLSMISNIKNDFDVICVCNDVITRDTQVLLQTKFTSKNDHLQLGYFMTLRPDYNLNAVSISFPKHNKTFIGKMHMVDFVLLGTKFTTEVDIDQYGLVFTTSCDMFNEYHIQLTGTADQNSEWNGLSFKLSGEFVKTNKSIHYLLQTEIYKQINRTVQRARLSEQSASMTLQRARSQFESINNTYTTRLQDYEATCREYDEALTELQNATARQTALEEVVDVADEILQDAREQIDNICEIEVCNDICIPGTVCEECNAAISSTVQGTCQVPCEKTENVQMLVGVRAYSCWDYRTIHRCVYVCICSFWFVCFADRVCSYTTVNVRTTCYENIYETVSITYTGTCIGQCDTGVMTANVVQQCCILSDCSNLVPNSTCTQLNSQCQMARDIAYAQLSTSETSLYEPLQMLDAARQTVSRTQVNVAQLRSEKIINEQLLNQSRIALAVSQINFSSIEMNNQMLVQQMMLTGIVGKANNTEDVVKVNKVNFTVSVITNTPVVFPVIVNYSFPQLGTSYRLEEIILDFEHINSSIMQRAVDLTDAVFNALNRRRKRQTDDNTASEQSGIEGNAMYYGERCTDIRNIQDYVNELVRSLETIGNVSAASKNAVMSNIIALADLSADSINNNVTNAVNLTYLEMEFGITINMSELMSNQEEISVFTNLLNNLQELTLKLAESIGENSFSEWQLKMEDLHNQTESAGGHFCFGFSDCLVTVGEVTGNLLRLTPLSAAAELLVKLQEAEKDLLDLALQSNLTIDEAIGKTGKILNVLEEFSQLNYWCVSIPNITVQPEERVTTVENNTVILTCEADSLVPVNYKWKKGSTDVPDAKSNTLVIENIKFSDAENYTCIATNHIGSVSSTNASVEVQELPVFFLQPDHQDIYLRDQNGAQFKCNATGLPNPGFRWYYKSQTKTEFTVVPGEDENEYIIPNTIPEHEGVYYCEAYNEQGAVQSRQVNLTVLGTTVVQLAQYFTFNVNAITIDSLSNDETSTSGSGSMSGSGIVNTPQNTLIKHLITVVGDMIDLHRATIENVTIVTLDDASLSITMGLYSYNVSYSGITSNDLLLIAPQARNEWGVVINELLSLLQNEEVIISDRITAYQVSSSSLQMGDIQLACPLGSAVHKDNQLLCVNCPAGSYQVNKRMIEVNEDGSETAVITPECVECPTGTYQYVQGQTQCTVCPDYHTTRHTSTRLPEDCIMLCPPGEYSIDGLAPCSKCPTGEYQISHGQLQCVVCPDYHSTYNEGSSNCLPLCSPGNYSTNGFEPCNECPCGSYSEVYGAVECINCSTIGAPQDRCNEVCSTLDEDLNDESEKTEINIAAIIGGTVGGVVVVFTLIIIIIVLVIFITHLMPRRRKKHKEDKINQNNEDLV